MSLENEMLELVEKNLPKLQGEALIKRLESVERLEQKINTLESQLKTRDDNNSVLNGKLKNQAELDDQELANKRQILELETREYALKAKEFDHKQELLDLKVAEAEKRASQAYNLVGILVKNPESVKSLTSRESGSIPIQTFQHNGMGISAYTQNMPIDKTIQTYENEYEKDHNPPKLDPSSPNIKL